MFVILQVSFWSGDSWIVLSAAAVNVLCYHRWPLEKPPSKPVGERVEKARTILVLLQMWHDTSGGPWTHF